MTNEQDSAVSLAGEADALAALIGSRICHDLVSPVGAISNGVELIGMGGCEADGPEMQLVADSVAHASSRLKFFRVAFGASSAGQMIGRTETELLLTDTYSGTRLKVNWGVTTDQPRATVKVAFLLLQCLESALPRGGEIYVGEVDGNWRIEAYSDRVNAAPELWNLLDGRALPETLKPAEVQFALAPRAAARFGRRIEYNVDGAGMTIKF